MDSAAARPNKVLPSLSVKRIKRSAVDTSRWDARVRNAFNETPLACSWVLDCLSPGWEGLIIGDYEGVMPLPVSHRLGMKMIQMPPEVLTLGIFSDNPEIASLFPQILTHPVFDPFRFIGYSGSPGLPVAQMIQGTTIKQTYELELNKPYGQLYQNYSRNHRRNIRSFFQQNMTIQPDEDHGTFIQLITEIGKKRPELYMPPGYRKKFESMMSGALTRQSKSYSVWQEGHLVGTAFFLAGDRRVIPFHAVNEKGHHYRCSFALIDHFIKQHAGQELVMDFAGSVMPHIAEFNRRFGAVPVPYPSVTINRLPSLAKEVKDKKLLFRLKHFILK